MYLMWIIYTKTKSRLDKVAKYGTLPHFLVKLYHRF
jgi:hypothetical protein